MSSIALITGANKGLGFEIARRLGSHGLSIIVTSRDTTPGESAVAALSDEGIEAEFVPMDVTDIDQINACASRVHDRYGRLDVLVNNAGISHDHWQQPSEIDSALLRRTMETNFFGAFNVTQAFVPLIRNSPQGRIVFMGSSIGSFDGILNPNSDYFGVISPAYQASKIALNSLSVLFARELKDAGVKVNSACPGWVRTDLGGDRAPRSVAEGADTPVWLATLPDDGPTGGFFRDRAPVAW